jgi:hypothetical protein
LQVSIQTGFEKAGFFLLFFYASAIIEEMNFAIQATETD